MPVWLEIVLGVLVLLLVLLAVGGAYARRRQLESTRPRFQASLAQVNEDLAAAHAADRGWEPAGLEAAARAAWAEQRGDAPVEDLTLIQIVDPPGTEEDKAVFRVAAAGREERLTLGRRDGAWVFERLD
jgi:septal ring-binding cell division protein DamX